MSEAATSKADKGYPVGTIRRLNDYYIDPRSIRRREGWNPRFDYGDIRALADSIKAELLADPTSGGLINNIRVRKLAKPEDGIAFELVDGDRRLTAVEMLMAEGVEFPSGLPAKIEKVDAEELRMLVRMFTANTGKPFLPLEEAAAFKRMKEAGMSNRDIKAATGRSLDTITAAFALLQASPELQAAVQEKKISSGAARAIAVNARGDVAKQKELVAAASSATTPKAKRAATQAIEVARRDKAEKQGRALKMRALTDDQLSARGASVSEVLVRRMESIGLAGDMNLAEWVRLDGGKELGVAYLFGMLEGLKAAAGMKIDLPT